MSRPSQRIEPMLEALRKAWEKHPDQRLGQVICNAAREHHEGLPQGLGHQRDPFMVEDDELWSGLERLAQ